MGYTMPMLKHHDDPQLHALHAQLSRALLNADTLRAEIKKRESELAEAEKSTLARIWGELE